METQDPATVLGCTNITIVDPPGHIRIPSRQCHERRCRGARYSYSVRSLLPSQGTQRTTPAQSQPWNEELTEFTHNRWEAINIGYSVIAVLLTGFEMVRTILECLTPKNLLSANLAKLFGVILCMIMDGLVTGTDLNGWADGHFVIHSLLM